MARRRQFEDEDIFPQFEDGLTDEQIATPLGVTRQAINKYRTRWQALKATEQITAHIEGKEAIVGELLIKQAHAVASTNLTMMTVEAMLGMPASEVYQLSKASKIVKDFYKDHRDILRLQAQISALKQFEGVSVLRLDKVEAELFANLIRD